MKGAFELMMAFDYKIGIYMIMCIKGLSSTTCYKQQYKSNLQQAHSMTLWTISNDNATYQNNIIPSSKLQQSMAMHHEIGLRVKLQQTIPTFNNNMITTCNMTSVHNMHHTQAATRKSQTQQLNMHTISHLQQANIKASSDLHIQYYKHHIKTCNTKQVATNINTSHNRPASRATSHDCNNAT